MEILDNDETLGASIGQYRPAVVPDPSTFEVLGAAFSSENDLYNLARYAVSPAFTDDPNFNIIEALKDNPYAINMPDRVGRAQSQEELDYITQQITRENKEREIISAAGFGGFVASGLAGMISPTSLVPLAGPARGIKGAAQAFALAGGAITAQEALLYGVQETRTGAEVFVGIAVGTVLGGLLGSAARYMTPGERVSIESGMASKRGEVAILNADETTGALSTTRLNTIRDVELPPMTPAAKSGSEVTVYRPGGEPVRGKVQPVTSAGVRKVVLEDGSTAQVGRDVFTDSPVSAKALIEVGEAGVSKQLPVSELTDEQMTKALARNTDELLTERVNAAQHERAILDAEQARRRGEEVPEEKLAYKEEAIEPEEVGAGKPGDSVGAKARNTRTTGLARPGPLRGAAIGALAKLNPLTRLIDGNLATARNWAAKIQLPGVRVADDLQNGPAAGSGTAYARSQVHGAAVVKFVQEYDDQYFKHLTGGNMPETKVGRVLLERFKAGMTVPEGKMSWREFGEAVYDVGNLAVPHADENVNKAAKAMDKYFAYMDKRHEEYYAQRLVEDGEDARRLYAKIEFAEDADVQNYVNHIYDTVQVENRMDEFINDMRAHGEMLMNNSFKTSWQAYHKARLAEVERYSDLTLNAKDFSQLTKGLERDIADVSKTYAKEMQTLVDYRKSMQAEGHSGKGLSEAMTLAREDLGPDYNAAIKQQRADTAKLKELNAGRDAVWDANAKKRKVKQEAAATEHNRIMIERERAFEDQWMARGADDLDESNGSANFARQSLEDAQELFMRIVGNPNRAVGMDLIGANRGSQLQRMLSLPYDQKRKYLNKNPESVIRAHNYSMAPDLELYRITGSPNGARIFDDMKREFKDAQEALINSTTEAEYGYRMGYTKRLDASAREQVPLTPERRQVLNAKQTADYKSSVQDMEVIITRMRRQRGTPENGNSFGYRLGRALQNANVFRYMGTVMPSSLPDVARPVMRYGLTSTFKNAWAPMIRGAQQVKMSHAEARRFNIATDPIMHNRSQALFDVGENHSTRQNMAERGLEFLSNKTGMVALFDRWTAGNQMLATDVVFAEFSNALGVIRQGTRGAEYDKAMRMMNRLSLDETMVARINRQYDLPGGSTEFDGGFRLPNTESWDDFETIMAMRAAINQEATDLIVTPGLDRPSWMDENAAYKLVAQFRSFTYTSTNRIMMSGLQDADMAYLNGAMMSLALGGLSYYTWAITSGGRSYESAMEASGEAWVYESLQRSGLLGVLSEGTRIGEQIPALNDYAVFGGEGRNSRRAGSVLGAVFGPSYDMAERLATIAQSLDSPTQSTLHQARVAMVPYQNVFYIRRLLDQVEDGLASYLPEVRGQ